MRGISLRWGEALEEYIPSRHTYIDMDVLSGPLYIIPPNTFCFQLRTADCSKSPVSTSPSRESSPSYKSTRAAIIPEPSTHPTRTYGAPPIIISQPTIKQYHRQPLHAGSLSPVNYTFTSLIMKPWEGSQSTSHLPNHPLPTHMIRHVAVKSALRPHR